MQIDEIGTPGQLAEVLVAEDRGIVLDFWGTWCQPCRTLRPHLESLADEYQGHWRFVAIHAEECPDLVDRYAVQSTPTLIYLKGGEEVHRSAGAITPSGVDEALAEHA